MNKSKTTEMDIEQITQEDQDIMSWEEVAKAINSSAYTVQEAATRVSPINKPPILPRMKHRVWPVEGVRYLGKLIKYDETFETWSMAEPEIKLSLCGDFLDLENLKAKILENYAPTKTLEWLQGKTSSVWEYNSFRGTMWTVSSRLNAQINYDAKNRNVCIEKLDAMEGHCTTMTPREFVERMEAGEWF